jgi:hypothetical protein
MHYLFRHFFYGLSLDLQEVGTLLILCQISNMGGSWIFTGMGAHLKKHLQDKIFKQLDKVAWSLGGRRSRKAKKVTRSGTTTSWENRVGRNQFGHKSSTRRLDWNQNFYSGQCPSKFLRSLEGRTIKTRISRTRNNL